MEWRRLLERSSAGKALSDAEVLGIKEISVPGYQRIGRPQVGRDSAANQWILDARKANTPEQIAALLKEYDGYYVVRLAKCDGAPQYSRGGLYVGADDTSFRGAFLNDCRDVLSEALLRDAWNHKFPEEAVANGKRLLAAADAAEGSGRTPTPRRTLRAQLGLHASDNKM